MFKERKWKELGYETGEFIDGTGQGLARYNRVRSGGSAARRLRDVTGARGSRRIYAAGEEPRQLQWRQV